MSEVEQEQPEGEPVEQPDAEPDAKPFEPPEQPDQPDPDEEAAEADEAAPPAEPQGATPEEWDARFAKSEKAFTAYTKRIFDLYGDDADQLHPIAISPGAPPGFLYIPDAGRVPKEMQAPVMEFFGITQEQDYAADPYTDACGTCEGKGATRTGSSVPGHEKRVCPTCSGRGFTVKDQPQGNGSAGVVVVAAPDASPLDDLPGGDVDAWGEPRILPDGRPNPNFGKMPQFKELVEPFGVTANLTAQDAVASEPA